MKYIMFKRRTADHGTIYHPVIFPNAMVHRDVARYLTDVHDQGPPPLYGFKVDSAGEVSLFNDVTCFGSSETLGVASKPERDTYIIKMNDYGGGLVF